MLCARSTWDVVCSGDNMKSPSSGMNSSGQFKFELGAGEEKRRVNEGSGKRGSARASLVVSCFARRITAHLTRVVLRR